MLVIIITEKLLSLSGLVILIDSRASLNSPFKWRSVVTAMWREPTYSGSRLQSNPIRERARCWRQATGLFNSPDDIRDSWSALMITHSTSLSLRQHTLHKGPAWAKSLCVEFILYLCGVWVTFLWNQGLSDCLHSLNDCHFTLDIVTPLVLL